MITRLQQVTDLLRKEDVEGLISMGAPDDEYDSEAEMITNRIGEKESEPSNRRISRGEVVSIIANVWKDMFSLSDEELAQRRESFESIAARIAP
jgi:hypothetical protein